MFALTPHRSQTIMLSTDPLFIDRVRDVVGLSLDPPQESRLAARRAGGKGSDPAILIPWTGLTSVAVMSDRRGPQTM